MKTLTLLDALETFCKQTLPTAQIALLNLPKVPASDLVVLMNPVPDEQIINGFQSRIITTWDVLYFHSHAARVVEGTEKLRKAFVHGITIPYMDTDGQMWYIRVQTFRPSKIFENESDLKYTFSKLETITKGVRNVEQFEMMQEIAFNKEVR
ncbi:hypothetical protein [Pseudobacillus wudalianchiensis]|uniref:Uncharacterized protein n=1 Tax=Pseudobacillus wudalianchiensis TaxID=1743143 RepID=A0A1B9AU45_9BACI|nr:hypothetical protein [Bacillus wudalianchiensis]OCA87294.1 hypothetical protein A8F95_08585 [Bacillus wudalianchiensis]